jgi:hypothetical protein
LTGQPFSMCTWPRAGAMRCGFIPPKRPEIAAK